MNCPHCRHPIPDAEVIRGAASIQGRRNAGKPRPGAKGLVRNPAGITARPEKDAPQAEPAPVESMDVLIERALQAQRNG